MSLSKLAKKLRLQDARSALLLDAPQGYLESLGPLPEEIEIHTQMDQQFDYALVFVKNRRDLDACIDRVLAAIPYDALLWISYPKGGSGVKTDLNRDKLWKALEGKGIRPVTQVSIDDTWSAMRFRPIDAVGK